MSMFNIIIIETLLIKMILIFYFIFILWKLKIDFGHHHRLLLHNLLSLFIIFLVFFLFLFTLFIDNLSIDLFINIVWCIYSYIACTIIIFNIFYLVYITNIRIILFSITILKFYVYIFLHCLATYFNGFGL